MTEKQNLDKKTNLFFKKYWNAINGEPPMWSEHWYFDGTIPNQEKRGCYALYGKSGQIFYIGVGIGHGTEYNHGAGLGYRLKRYWQVNKSNIGTQYEAREGWKNVTSIRRIGFEPENYELAAALEIFLIKHLNPVKSTLH